MFKSYIKIGWRNLVKNKGYSFINIGGLAMGMTVAMLIGLWVKDELSFNAYHSNYDHIAQVMQNQSKNGELESWNTLPYPFIHELKENYSNHFKHIVTSTQTSDYILSAGDKKFSRRGVFIEADAPEMLSLKMIRGTWTGLKDQQSILLCESTAKVLFGDADPMNQSIKIDTDKDVKVTGVYEDLPLNTRFHEMQFFSSWDYFVATNRFMKEKQWDNHAVSIYVQIQSNTSFAKVNSIIEDSELNVIKNLDNMKEEAATLPQIWLHPMSDWHLYSNFKNGFAENGPIQYVLTVGTIGLFVLFLACINFMNLSTARSERRAKEVGVRKVIGSARWQLVGQFFAESYLVIVAAFIFAIVLVSVSLPSFNDLAAKQIAIPWTNFYFWLFSYCFIFLTGLLAGSYPALFLSSFQPISMLKGALHIGRFASLPRKILVVVQFTISVSLIICTMTVYRQVQFAKNRPVGYSREGLVMVEKKYGFFPEKLDVLRNELKSTGAVMEIAESQSPVTGVWSSNSGFKWKDNPTSVNLEFATLTVSHEYAKTVGWQFLEGRNFIPGIASDSTSFVINETAAKLMELDHPVGETMKWKSQWMTNNVEKSFQVIGVVKDMVMESPFESVKPTVFFLWGAPNWINIKLNPQMSTTEALTKIEAVFKILVPDVPFDYKFADEEYAQKFGEEERIGKLTSVFATLTILISCLGLFGLASFVAEQRTKEIGIRKILGASVGNLWNMLSKDFILLVAISCAISIPVAYYFMNNWLRVYEYRTEMSTWIFVMASIGALLITLLIVSFQTLKAAISNPINSLRSE